MLSLMAILLAAALGHAIAAWRRLPAVPVMIAMGLVLSATDLGGDEEVRLDALRLGLIFVLFMVGAELDPAIVRGRRRASVIFGLVQFLMMGGLGVVAAIRLGFDARAAAFAGMALAGSSTLVVVSTLRRREQMFEDLGRTAIGVVLLQDLIVIVGLPVVAATGASDAVKGLFGAAGLVLLALGLARWIMPRLLTPLAREPEAMLLVILATLFAFAGLADAIGIAPEIGAFTAGLSLARFPVNGLVRGPMASLSDFFLAVFCVALGSMVPLQGLREIVPAVAMLGVILVVAPMLLVPVARAVGLTTRSSIELTGLLAQAGEMAVAVMVVGLVGGQVPEPLFRIVVLVAVITMLLAPALSSDAAAWRLMRIRGRLGPAAAEGSAAGRAVFLGCGSSTRRLLRRVVDGGGRVLVIDDDPGVVADLRAEGIDAIRGDGADPRLLHRIGLRDATMIVSTMRRRRDQERLLRLSGDVPVIVRTFDPETARWLQSRGAMVVSEAETAERAFMQWFDAWSPAESSAAG